MTEQERLERRVRFADAMEWKCTKSPFSERWDVSNPKGGYVKCDHDNEVLAQRTGYPDPDTNSDDRWALLEWFIRQPYVSDLRMWVYPAVSKKPGVSGVYASLPYPNIPNCEADTLTEALLQAIDAALLAGKEGK